MTPPPPAATGSSGAGDPNLSSMSPRGPVHIDACGPNNPAGVSDADVQALSAAANPGPMRWLYPYEGTVFPRGMGAPLLMWEGTTLETAIYVHIQSLAFEYRGCLPPTASGQLQLPQDVWMKAGEQTNGKTDPYTMELAVLAGGAVTGPLVLHFTIAQATIKGSIFYSSYESKLEPTVPAMPSGTGPGDPPDGKGGKVLRIPQGGTAEVFASNGCVACHSVSADGSLLLAQLAKGSAQAYELFPGVLPNPPSVAAGPRGAYGALYPDGSVYLSMSAVIDVAHSGGMQAPGAPQDATLYDTRSGAIVPNVGIPGGALMPMFSPDGTLLAFNDYAIANADGLAVMTYDVRTHTATDYRLVMQDDDPTTRPGWPFFLPDNRALVFLRTASKDFSGNGVGLGDKGGKPGPGGGPPGGAPKPEKTGSLSDLYVVDLATRGVTLLAQAMGFTNPQAASTDTTYLPYGVDETHRNFYPTVSPVASGGYFWVFFDSYRHYGNLGKHRQLWGTAIDIQPDGSYIADHSHPAFYLPGQEFGTGNHRAFASLDPCKQDGDQCSSGIDCCGGFCYLQDPSIELVDPIGTCAPPPTNQCAKRDERCTTNSDCCLPAPGDPPYMCIAGFCAYIGLE